MKKTIREVIGEAIGEASMCWSETPTGIFESSRAEELVQKILDAFHLEAGVNVTRWVELKSRNSELEEQAQALVSALKGAACEANQHLTMYIGAYKQEPYDTGIMLKVYVKESIERMKRYEQALEEYEAWKRGQS